MLVFRNDARTTVHARTAARLMLLGGAPLEGARHVWWNFVSSSSERIERAKDEWRRGLFAKVPGDEVEFIPLPE
jgi:redox-sensitive bicupin YhaK (pirin superfamily)